MKIKLLVLSIRVSSCRWQWKKCLIGAFLRWFWSALRSWLWPWLSKCFLVIKLDFSSFCLSFHEGRTLDPTVEQLCVIKHSSEHVELEGRQINISSPCVRSKVASLDTSYHPPLLPANAPAPLPDGINRWNHQRSFIINYLLCMKRKNRKATPTCSRIFPFFWTLRYSFLRGAAHKHHVLSDAVIWRRMTEMFSYHPAPASHEGS